jgi:hypothetical protein
VLLLQPTACLGGTGTNCEYGIILRCQQNERYNDSVASKLTACGSPCVCLQDQDGKELGVAGSVQQLAQRSLSSQPVNSFDWSPDKQGLFVCSALDQCLRVGFVTKLNKL